MSPACTPKWDGTFLVDQDELHRQAAEKAEKNYQLALRASFNQLLEPGSSPLSAMSLQASATPLEMVVVGREISEKDKQLYALAKRAIDCSRDASVPASLREKVGLKRVIRGTYFLSCFDEDFRNGLLSILSGIPAFSEDKPCKALVEYVGLPTQTLAVFKPGNETRGGDDYIKLHREGPIKHGAKDGIHPSSEICNEVIFVGLAGEGPWPHAMQVKLSDSRFFKKGVAETPSKTYEKTGSIQVFIPSCISFTGLPDPESALESLPLTDFQKLAIWDLALVNTDRNHENILVNPNVNRFNFIDQSLLLPARFQSYCDYVWMNWKMALEPFTEQALKEISALNFRDDLAKIKKAYPDYPPENLETMQIAYYFLQRGTAMGLTPFMLGCFYSSGGYISIMRRIYDNARARLGDNADPKLVFSLVVQGLNGAMKALQEAYPKLKAEAEQTADTRSEPLNEVLKASIEKFLMAFITDNLKPAPGAARTPHSSAAAKA